MKFASFFSRHGTAAVTQNGDSESNSDAAFESARRAMVEQQIQARGVHSVPVLNAMASVPRHLFVPPEHIADAYNDSPLAIGAGQTISQPYIVAVMADALSLDGTENVLEIGGGSGYQAAVLSLLAHEVIAVEANTSLADAARDRLARLGYRNVRIEAGDGSLGWNSDQPFNAILVTAAAPSVPPPLVEQLADGGRLVIPVGPTDQQELLRIVKRDGRLVRESLLACRFVPLLGRYGWRAGDGAASGPLEPSRR